MKDSITIGRLGEDQATAYLHSIGYSILERNWRFSKAEIDIIAKQNQTVVFVEVKTRANENFGKPEEFVSKYQEQLISDAASQYMEQINHTWEIRFDIISIIMKNGLLINLNHFEDAFFPSF